MLIYPIPVGSSRWDRSGCWPYSPAPAQGAPERYNNCVQHETASVLALKGNFKRPIYFGVGCDKSVERVALGLRLDDAEERVRQQRNELSPDLSLSIITASGSLELRSNGISLGHPNLSTQHQFPTQLP